MVDAYDRMRGAIEEIEAPLKVCRNCLRKLNFGGYGIARGGQRRAIWLNFSIEKFFEECASHFPVRPAYNEVTAPPSDYTHDWYKITLRVREERNWQCEECKVVLREHKGFLHVHHKNHVKSDNSPSNLQVLCSLCHQKKPGHRQMHVSRKAKQIIYELRRRRAAR